MNERKLISEELLLLHQQACEAESDTYLDPLSQLPVFTELYHLKRGSCCKSGCRHCPYGYSPDTISNNEK